MTLRRYASMKPSRGTVIPPSVRIVVMARDRSCVGPKVGMPGDCFGQLELDHIRVASFGGKSPSVPQNLAALCSVHHRVKTLAGREWRPKLLDYIAHLQEPTP